MGVFSAAGGAAPHLTDIAVTQVLQVRALGTQAIRGEDRGKAVALGRLPKEFQGRYLVPRLNHKASQDIAIAIDGAPDRVPFVADLHENLVEVPASLPASLHPIDPLAPDLGPEPGAEPQPPEADGLMALS